MKFFKKTKGVISIFLIMVMLPLFTSAVLLVDGARYHSAKTLIQEAGDLAAYSVIANYDLDLKDEYGLFAIDDEDTTATFAKYFKESLGCGDSESQEYSEKVQGMLSNLIYGNEYSNANFYNLYNFNVLTATAEGKYPLSEPGVLQNQIVEYTKYRGVETILERFEIIKKFNELEGESDNSSKMMEAIEDLAAVDQEDSKKVSEAIEALRDTVSAYNEGLNNLYDDALGYENYYISEMCNMAVKDLTRIDFMTKYRKIKAEEIKKKIGASDEGLRTQYDNIFTSCDVIKQCAEDAIADYTALRDKYADQEDIVSDIDSELGILKKIISTDPNDKNYSVIQYKESLPAIEDVCGSFNEFQLILDEMEDYANSAVDLYNSEYQQTKTELQNKGGMSAEEIETYLYENVLYDMYVKGSKWQETQGDYLYESSVDDTLRNVARTAVAGYNFSSTVKSRRDSRLLVDDILNYYTAYAEDNKTVTNKETGEKVTENKDKSEDAVEKANNSSKSKDNSSVETDSKANQTIADDKYKNLPSQAAKTSPQEEKAITELDKNKPKAMLSSSKSAGSEFMKFLESGRNDVLTFCYILDTFKTRNSAVDYSKKTQGKWYSTDWRFLDDSGEVDLRDRRKDASLTTFFNTSEVEYVFGGNKSETLNNTIVYSWIYGTRLANNIVAVYTNPTAKAECLALAAAASAASFGFFPVSVMKWVFIAAWAAGETALEMTYLMTDGYRVPLVKTKNNLFIDSFTDVLDGFNEDSRENLMAEKTGKGINVCYEDYLLLLLCFVGRETRLLRVADLIELNMQERGHSDFKMSKANTYVEANTNVSVKFLFQPVKQFSQSYSGTGFSISNIIYQGY